MNRDIHPILGPLVIGLGVLAVAYITLALMASLLQGMMIGR